MGFVAINFGFDIKDLRETWVPVFANVPTPLLVGYIFMCLHRFVTEA